jgi:hypothetical protein
VVIAGSDRTTRRRSVRRQEAPSFAGHGAALRQAREQLDLSLTVVQDRTGVHSRDLEALEDGDLSRFRDERAALVAVRRYADTVGLDAAVISQAVVDQWRSVSETPVPMTTGMTAATPRSAPALAPPPAPTPAPAPAIRPLADSSHLRAFTQTAQVPRVAGDPAPRPTLPPGLRFDSTDAIPVTTRPAAPGRPPASMSLRVTVWTVVLLLLVAVAGLSVDHWRPGWLAKIHLTASAPPPSGTAPHGGGRAAAPIVISTTTGPLATAVTVHSPGFEVVVATQQACWIHVTDPSGKVPVFSATVPAGTTKIFTSVNGQLSVELGASRVLVAVQILGKTVPRWLFAPSAVPYVLTFHSVTG